MKVWTGNNDNRHIEDYKEDQGGVAGNFNAVCNAAWWNDLQKI